jgi:hypothetical protein
VNTSAWTIADVGTEYSFVESVRFANAQSSLNQNIVKINTNKYLTIMQEVA